MTKHRATAPRAQRGETLAEVLVALLIVALATLLLVAMAGVSANINISARKMDKDFYAALSKVEAMESGTLASGTYQVGIYNDAGSSVKNFNVSIYTSDGLTLYKRN